jgi:hypothetical protein
VGDELLNVDMRVGTKMGIRFTNALVGRLGLHGDLGLRNEEDMESEAPPPYTPPPYSAVLASAEDGRNQNHSGGERESDSDSSENSVSKGRRQNYEPPAYDSVRRSSHSLRDLLDAVEPPREPAPAPLSHQRRWSEGGYDPKVELKVAKQNSRVTAVTMGERKIIHVRRDKVMDYNLSGPMPKWEVEIAEGVDLVLVSLSAHVGERY